MPACISRMLRAAIYPTVGLALLLATLACDGQAQGTTAGTAATNADYRLTMPVLRRLLPALHHAEAEAACREIGGAGADAFTMTAAEFEAAFDQCAPVKQALGRADLSIHEAAAAFAAMMQAMLWLMRDQEIEMSGGQPRPLPERALGANVALLRENQAELERLNARSR